MRLSPWLLLAMVGFVPATACKDNVTPEGDADTDADTDGDTDTDTDTDTTPDTDAADFSEAGNLNNGSKLGSLTFAHGGDNDPCWPSTEDVNFDGNHVFFVFDKEGNDLVTFRVEPDPGVDVSLYVMEFPSDGDVEQPPPINGISRCEAAYDQKTDGNPGEAEEVSELYGFPDRGVLIGVAGANDTVSGGFVLKAWRETSN